MPTTTIQTLASAATDEPALPDSRETTTIRQIEEGRNYAAQLSAEVDAIMDSVTPVEIFANPKIREYLQGDSVVHNDPADINVELGEENTEFSEWIKTELIRDIPMSVTGLIEGITIDQSVDEPTLELGPNGIVMRIPRPLNAGQLKQSVYLGVASIFRNSATDERLEEFYEICKRNPQIVHINQLQASSTYLNARELLKQRSENSAVIVNEAEALHFLRTGKMMATENQLLGRYAQREVNRTAEDDRQEAIACHRIARYGLAAWHTKSFDYAFLNMYIRDDIRGKRPDIMDVLAHGNDRERDHFMVQEILERSTTGEEAVRLVKAIL